jgi:hypothetical protein
LGGKDKAHHSPIPAPRAKRLYLKKINYSKNTWGLGSSDRALV